MDYSSKYVLDERTAQLFDTVLFMIRPALLVGTRAHIGGGAVRDALLGRAVKDIDVFVPQGSIVDDLHAYPEVFPGFHDMGEEMIQYLEVKALKRIVSLGTCGAFEVQLIEYDDSMDLFDTFDIGLCRVSYGPSESLSALLNVMGNGLRVSEEFAFDHLNKTITVHSPNGVERTMKRIERLKQKYQDFTPVWSGVLPATADEEFH